MSKIRGYFTKIWLGVCGILKFRPTCVICSTLSTGGPSSRCEELLLFFFFKNLYANVQLCEARYRDIVTAVIYCYITTLGETWLWPFSMWRCYVTTVWIYKGLYGKNAKRHFSWNFDIFSIKMTYLKALLPFLLPVAFSAIGSLLSELSLFEFPLLRKSKG